MQCTKAVDAVEVICRHLESRGALQERIVS